MASDGSRNNCWGSLPLVSSAPGKVILFGEHAVVHGKLAIASSLGLRVYALFEKAGEKDLVLDLQDLKLHCAWTKDQLKPIYDHEFLKSADVRKPTTSAEFLDKLKNLIPSSEKINSSSAEARGVLAFLFLYFVTATSKLANNPNMRLKITVKSFLPIGMGLGSSGSFSVCIANGLLAAFNIKACSGNCPHCVNSDPCREQKELINGWAFQAEKIAHGNPSGIDNSVSTFGGTLTLRRTPEKTIVTPQERTPALNFLLTNTKVPRNTAQLVGKVGEFVKANPSKAVPMLEEIDDISKTCVEEFAKENPNRKQLIEKIGKLMDRNHLLLNALGVGHPALDRVCKVTSEFGFHSKLTGAGGGGCALTLLEDNTSKSEIEKVKNALQKPEGDFKFECFVAEIGGKGVTLQKPSELPFKFYEGDSQRKEITILYIAAIGVVALAIGFFVVKRNAQK